MASGEREDQPAFDPRLLNGLRRAAEVAETIVIVVAVLVLVGWALNVEVLRSVIPGLTAMNPGGTALAFLLTGMSLWCLTKRERDVRFTQAARVMAAAVVVLATLRLVLYVLGLEWGPDQLAVSAPSSIFTSPPIAWPQTPASGTVAGQNARCLCSTSETRARKGVQRQWLALAAGLLSLFALIGYACNAAALIGIRTYIPMGL